MIPVGFASSISNLTVLSQIFPFLIPAVNALGEREKKKRKEEREREKRRRRGEKKKIMGCFLKRNFDFKKRSWQGFH